MACCFRKVELFFIASIFAPVSGAAELVVARDFFLRVDGLQNAEISGVAVIDRMVYLANDKPSGKPDTSAVWRIDWDKFVANDSSGLEALKRGELNRATKIEDIAPWSRGGKSVLVGLTAFDRYSEDGKLDSYNQLFALDPLDQSYVIPTTLNYPNGLPNGVRQLIKRSLESALDQPDLPYFKVEGLAIGPAGMLFLGVREVGESYTVFNSIALILAGWLSDDGALRLGPHLTPMLRIDPAAIVRDVPEMASLVDGISSLGISALAFHPVLQRLFVVTSFEIKRERDQTDLGAVLWQVNPDWKIEPITIVGKNQARTKVFRNKVEGIAIGPKGELVLVCDDDMVTQGPGWTRKLNEFRVIILDFPPAGK